MSQATPERRAARGISLVEICICCVILAVLLSQAIPSLLKFTHRQQLQGIAQTLMTDLQEARSISVRQGKAVHLQFSESDSGSCYVMHSGKVDACGCSGDGRAICEDSAALVKVEWLPAHRAVTLRANVEKLSFNPRQGSVTSAGSIDITRQGGPAIRHVVAITGRVRSCTPDGSFSRLPRCTR